MGKKLLYVLYFICFVLMFNILFNYVLATSSTNPCGRSDFMQKYCSDPGNAGSTCCGCGGTNNECINMETHSVAFNKYCNNNNKCVFYNNSNNPYWFGGNIGTKKTTDSGAYCTFDPFTSFHFTHSHGCTQAELLHGISNDIPKATLSSDNRSEWWWILDSIDCILKSNLPVAKAWQDCPAGDSLSETLHNLYAWCCLTPWNCEKSSNNLCWCNSDTGSGWRYVSDYECNGHGSSSDRFSSVLSYGFYILGKKDTVPISEWATKTWLRDLYEGMSNTKKDLTNDAKLAWYLAGCPHKHLLPSARDTIIWYNTVWARLTKLEDKLKKVGFDVHNSIANPPLSNLPELYKMVKTLSEHNRLDINKIPTWSELQNYVNFLETRSQEKGKYAWSKDDRDIAAKLAKSIRELSVDLSDYASTWRRRTPDLLRAHNLKVCLTDDDCKTPTSTSTSTSTSTTTTTTTTTKPYHYECNYSNTPIYTESKNNGITHNYYTCDLVKTPGSDTCDKSNDIRIFLGWLQSRIPGIKLPQWGYYNTSCLKIVFPPTSTSTSTSSTSTSTTRRSTSSTTSTTSDPGTEPVPEVCRVNDFDITPHLASLLALSDKRSYFIADWWTSNCDSCELWYLPVDADGKPLRDKYGIKQTEYIKSASNLPTSSPDPAYDSDYKYDKDPSNLYVIENYPQKWGHYLYKLICEGPDNQDESFPVHIFVAPWMIWYEVPPVMPTSKFHTIITSPGWGQSIEEYKGY